MAKGTQPGLEPEDLVESAVQAEVATPEELPIQVWDQMLGLRSAQHPSFHLG